MQIINHINRNICFKLFIAFIYDNIKNRLITRKHPNMFEKAKNNRQKINISKVLVKLSCRGEAARNTSGNISSQNNKSLCI